MRTATLYFDEDEVRVIEEAIHYWYEGGDESFAIHLAKLVIEKYKEAQR